MSLVTYQEAYPWAQSIREEVLGLRMPPWRAEDGFGDFSNGHALSAQEMDMILEWSSGGYPQGPRDQQPEPLAESTEWGLGEPDVELMMDEAFTIDSDVNDVVRYFVLPSTITDTSFLVGADVMPGAGAVVRGFLRRSRDAGGRIQYAGLVAGRGHSRLAPLVRFQGRLGVPAPASGRRSLQPRF